MVVHEFGPFQLDAERLLLLRDGSAVPLGPTVVRTLLVLIEKAGDIVPKAEIMAAVWPDGCVEDANLTQNVYVLRRTLRAWDPDAIQTVPRRGYRFSVRAVRRDGRLARSAPYVFPTSRRHTAMRILAAAAVALLVSGAGAAITGLGHGRASPVLSVAGARMYAVGKFYLNTRTRDGVLKSVGYFGRVVDSDPLSGRGYSGLAAANEVMGAYAYGSLRPREYFRRARAYASKALAVDPRSAEAYAVLGRLSSFTDVRSATDVARALPYFTRALDLDPADASAHEWYGIALVTMGRFAEGDEQLREASNLDPLSVATTSYLAQTAYLERRYDAAIAYARDTLALAPDRAEEYRTIGLAYEAEGSYPRALQAFRRMSARCARCRAEASALMADAYARSNDLVKARAELALARARPSEVCESDLVIAFASAGERSSVLSWLRRPPKRFVGADVSSDPRFEVVRNVLGMSAPPRPLGG
jgi:DNA-binding winged helix-turn-helix (wHTH) protein/tetratricopeptide (TPR) repeat protein